MATYGKLAMSAIVQRSVARNSRAARRASRMPSTLFPAACHSAISAAFSSGLRATAIQEARPGQRLHRFRLLEEQPLHDAGAADARRRQEGRPLREVAEDGAGLEKGFAGRQLQHPHLAEGVPGKELRRARLPFRQSVGDAAEGQAEM